MTTGNERLGVANTHAHRYSRYNRAFLVGVVLNLAFVGVEAAYGILADSLALLADAGHNLSDVLGLLLAWGGVYLARRKRTPRRTYGWRRASIYAAFLNGVILLLAVGGIGVEAVRRLLAPAPSAGVTIIIVAAAGVGVNALTAFLFMRGRRGDLNIRGAFLHMAADAAVSAGVVLAGLAIIATGWRWIDPAVSLAVAVVILAGTWGLMRDAVNLAMDAVPGGIDPARVRQYLESLPGVGAVHDLHIWAMSTTDTALTAHLEQDDPSVDLHALTTEAGAQLDARFGIGHSTLQWEWAPADGAEATCSLEGGRPCDQAPEG
jgi:cobalt-zinc-cadmium efflux system protein